MRDLRQDGRRFHGRTQVPLCQSVRNSPYFGFVVLVPLDELGRERQAFSNGNLEGGDTIVVADKVVGDTGLVEVEILLLPSFHGSLQAIFGVIDASAHSCAVSFPGDFTELDGGDETSDDLSKAFGGTSLWAAKVARTVLGDMGALSLKMAAEGWSLAMISTESGRGDVTE